MDCLHVVLSNLFFSSSIFGKVNKNKMIIALPLNHHLFVNNAIAKIDKYA
jgi:hypothetical protein